MKKLIVVFTSFILLNSCTYTYTTGIGKIVTEKREVPNFSAISVSNAIDVDVKMGTANGLMVEADDNIIKNIATEVSGSILKISLHNLHSINNSHIKIYITATQLNSISASASAEVKVLDDIKSDGKISFTASSSAGITASVQAPNIDAEASSSATVTLTGRTKNYTASASSSGEIKSAQLLSENTTAEANSSGSADVYASVSLTATASSSGDIIYHGAANVNKSISSSGSVEKRD